MAAILHLGNVDFKGNSHSHSSFEDPSQAETIAKVYIIYFGVVCNRKYFVVKNNSKIFSILNFSISLKNSLKFNIVQTNNMHMCM